MPFLIVDDVESFFLQVLHARAFCLRLKQIWKTNFALFYIRILRIVILLSEVVYLTIQFELLCTRARGFVFTVASCHVVKSDIAFL